MYSLIAQSILNSKYLKNQLKLLKDKSHLTIEGKKKMIDFKKRLNKDYKLPDFICITDA
jgi:hypothetical protein